jgi:hypothetical protein
MVQNLNQTVVVVLPSGAAGGALADTVEAGDEPVGDRDGEWPAVGF